VDDRHPTRKRLLRWTVRFLTHGVVAVIGWSVGGSLMMKRELDPWHSDPLSRVYLWIFTDVFRDRLASEPVPALAKDLDAVESQIGTATAGVVHLIVHLKGVTRDGALDYERAEAQCRGMGWARCDRAALERMRAEIE
jgi:hypothetical protein